MEKVIDFQAMIKRLRETQRETQNTTTSTAISKEYKCPKCQDKGGFICKEEKNGMAYEYWQDCSCVLIERAKERLKHSNLSETQIKQTFDAYRAETVLQKKAKETCMEFAKRDKGNLILCGQIGSGKTHLAIATLLGLTKRGKTIKIFNYKDMVKNIGLSARDDYNYYHELDKYRKPTVVLIDDFLKGNDHKETHLSYAYEVINYRYEKDKMTLITSEKTVDEMMRIEEAITSRLLEKAKGFIVLMDGIKNYRIK